MFHACVPQSSDQRQITSLFIQRYKMLTICVKDCRTSEVARWPWTFNHQSVIGSDLSPNELLYQIWQKSLKLLYWDIDSKNHVVWGHWSKDLYKDLFSCDATGFRTHVWKWTVLCFLLHSTKCSWHFSFSTKHVQSRNNILISFDVPPNGLTSWKGHHQQHSSVSWYCVAGCD